MKLTKRVFIYCFFVLILLYSVSGQGVTSGLEEGVEQVEDTAENIKDFTEGEKWEYLGDKWKEALLKNETISDIHNWLKKIDFLFVFLFGQSFDLSLILLLVISLWIFFFIIIGRILSDFSSLSKGISYIVSFILVIVLAQLRALEGLSLILFKILFFREGIWGWLWIVIFIFVYFLILLYLERIIWRIGRSLKRTKEAKEKWDELFQRQLFRKKIESMERALGTIEGGLRG